MYTPPPPIKAIHLMNSNSTFKSKLKHRLQEALGDCPGCRVVPSQGSHLTLSHHSDARSAPACLSNYKAFDPWRSQNDWYQSLVVNEAKKNRRRGDRAEAGEEERGRRESAEDRRQRRSTEVRGSRCPSHRDSDAHSCFGVLLVIKACLITEPQNTMGKGSKSLGRGRGRWSLLKHLREKARIARPHRIPQR